MKRFGTALTTKKLFARNMFVLVLWLSISSCSEASHYVIIEAENPDEKDFVVECLWNNSAFSLHGGNKVVKRKLLMANANELVDCGSSMWQLIGSNFHVRIHHPMCGGGASIDDIEERTDKEGVTREVYVVQQRTLRNSVDEKIIRYTGKELYFKLENSAQGILYSTGSIYSKHYQQVTGHPVNVELLKKQYNDRLLNELNYIRSNVISNSVTKEHMHRFNHPILMNPESAMNKLWSGMTDKQENNQ